MGIFGRIGYLYTNGYNQAKHRDRLSMKPLVWMGSSYKDLRELPSEVQDLFGFALYLAQTGGKSIDAKVLQGFGGAGVLEVVENHKGDAYRAVYTVRYADAVYVLHCFQKKSKSGIATPKPDMDKIQERLNAVEAQMRKKQ